LRIVALLVLATSTLTSGCSSALAELEEELFAAVADEDGEAASRILEDERWKPTRNPELDDRARALANDDAQLAELQTLEGGGPNCYERYDFIKDIDYSWEFDSYEEKASGYIEDFGKRCGEAIFQTFEDYLKGLEAPTAGLDPDSEFGEVEKGLISEFAWVDAIRADALLVAIERREQENEAAKLEQVEMLKAEIDVTLQKFNTLYDEFDDSTTYRHKTTISKGGLRLNFTVAPQGCGAMAYLSVQYSASSWLFMDRIEIKQSGETVFVDFWDIFDSAYNGEVLTGSGSIRETWSTFLRDDELDELALLSETEALQIRVSGETRELDVVFGPSEISAIKETVGLYRQVDDFTPLATELGFGTEKDGCFG
jgi:hypothetical protein